LVTQQLKNISREALEQFQPIIYKFIRGRRGVQPVCSAPSHGVPRSVVDR
jgi:hypothetical protein